MKNLRNDLKNAAARIWHAVLCAMLLGSTALACGGADEGDAGDLGTEQESLSAAHPGYGVSTAASHLMCNDTNAGQSCILPRSRDYTWCFATDVTPEEAADVRNGFSRANVKLVNRFTFTEITGVTATQCIAHAPAPTILLQKQLCSGSFTSNTLESFVCYTPGSLLPISETVPGTWQTWSRAAINLDNLDINQKGLTDRSCLRSWGVEHAALGLAGLGSTDSGGASNDPFGLLVTGRRLIVGASNTFNENICQATFGTGPGAVTYAKNNTISAQQTCLMRAYNNGSPNVFAFNSGTCP